ncbi:MAG: hypothetical protein JNK04_00485 [Myxococcales bacterium]|nr:hypothetical protein [Myxococcales bacterium]
MPLCTPGYEPLAVVAKPTVRVQLGLDLGRVLSLFVTFHQSLEAIHLAGAVVGDLNDQNELFEPASGNLRFIDADSFQIGGFPCEVVTEAYLDPLLYGPDPAHPSVTADGKPRWFGRGSDWYAFAALLFRSLTGVHPFGGSTKEPLSLSERAIRRQSALGAGVTLPRPLRARVAALPADLLGALAGTFEKGERAPLPIGLLEAAQRGARVCSCGLELAGGVRVCPACTASRAAASSVEAVELLRSRGVVLACGAAGSSWFAFVRAEDRHLLVSGRFDASERRERELLGIDPTSVQLEGHHLAVAGRGTAAPVRVVDAARGTTMLETTTETAFGRAAFALGGGVLHRIARGSLIATELESGRETTRLSVVSEQTCLHPRPGGVFAVTAVLGRRHYVAVDARVAIELDVEPLGPGERLLAETIRGDERHILLLRHVASGGAEWVLTSLFAADGTALRNVRTAAAGRAAGTAIAGGILAKGAYLVATDGGLVREDVTAPSTSVTFPGTAPFVSLESELVACAFGLIARLGCSLHLLSQKPP